VEFRLGQVFVYGGHGPGRLVAREERGSGDRRCEVIVLELAATLKVTLPLTLAHRQLRPLASERQLESVKQTLRATPPACESVWIKRQKATRAKLAAGEPIGLAEVVSDGARRHDADGAHLSMRERELYLKARRLLAGEIGLVRGIEPSLAEDWISDQLSHASRQNLHPTRR
jgi:RNA polymerase-interacting CarD/CdnL/TRCF family regulator